MQHPTFEIYNRAFSSPDPILPRLEWTVERYTSKAFGGPFEATITARGDLMSLWELLETLRCPVQIRSDKGDVVWWGYVSAIDIVAVNPLAQNNMPIQVSASLETLFNRVAVAYNKADCPALKLSQQQLADVFLGDIKPGEALKCGKGPINVPTHALEHPSLDWPTGLLYGQGNRLAGYLMPYIRQAVPVLVVFNPRRRVETLAQFDRRYLHRAARNLATAVGALHTSGYVVGDLNESNVLVKPSALVTLIDTDSFQVQEVRGSQVVTYACPVAKPEYTPPEFAG